MAAIDNGGNQLDAGRSTADGQRVGSSRFLMQLAVDGHRTANCLHDRTSAGASSRLARS
jgi:hypothetical protein